MTTNWEDKRELSELEVQVLAAQALSETCGTTLDPASPKADLFRNLVNKSTINGVRIAGLDGIHNCTAYFWSGENDKLEKAIELLTDVVVSELSRPAELQSSEVQSKIIGSMFFLPKNFALDLLQRFAEAPDASSNPGSKVGMGPYAQDMIQLIKISGEKKKESKRKP